MSCLRILLHVRYYLQLMPNQVYKLETPQQHTFRGPESGLATFLYHTVSFYSVTHIVCLMHAKLWCSPV